ncbi:MAG: phosphate acyltransferase PlsX [Candidatus Eremiobacteraeota bacterium]|nr:phosphate acyltransferase PlsX [Candidatus Eremiobacteraeota bacterium]
MKIAIDAMGGDNAPDEIVKGAFAALKGCRCDIVLVGDRERIKKCMPGKSIPKRITIHHTEQFVEMHENPTLALRKKKNSSILLAAELLKKGEVSALISAGNTGALMESVLLTVGRVKGVKIKRPALSVFLPSYRQHTVFLDAGANSDCKPEYLLQFAKMGRIYARNILNRENPKVGLINIGSESGKGNMLTLAAYELLSRSDLNFVGNVEPRDLFYGEVDVAVADGFVGNMVLKTTEGTAELLIRLLKDYIKQGNISKMAALFLKPAFDKLKKKLDHSEYGGALLFGVNGVCIKSHGRADSKTMQNAVKLAEKIVNQDIIRRFAEDLSEEPQEEAPAVKSSAE